MATAPASGGECFIPVEATAHADDAADGGESDESSQQVQQRASSSADMVRRRLKKLNRIVFCVALLEWAGNAVGTVAFIWATVVLLGGFCSLLNRMDFWFSEIMIFVEGSRVFIRNDASVNQWLFGSTSAFRWDNLSLPTALQSKSAMFMGVGISFTPIETRSEIVGSTLKMALLVIFSQLQNRSKAGQFVLLLFAEVAFLGGMVGAGKLVVSYIKRSKANPIVSFLKIWSLEGAWVLGTSLAVLLATSIMSHITFMRKPVPLLCFKVIIAAGLACLPFLQAIVASYYRYLSIAVGVVLLILTNKEIWGEEEAFFGVSPALADLWPRNPGEALGMQCAGGFIQTVSISSRCGLLLHILETILPIVFIWSVMFPLPGISLKIAFYMLFSVMAAVLIANLQIPVAFLQVLLSALRLRSLLGHEQHDYHPLPPDASPNLVPSIVIFFMMELCQGSSYILATILGLISLFSRISLVRYLGFKEEWGAKAVNLYHQQAYQARTEKGLLPSEKSMPSLTSSAIECLGSTSIEQQDVELRILDTFLQQWDPESKMELITEITSASKKAVLTLIGMLCSTVAGEKDIRMIAARVISEITAGSIKISEFPGMVKLMSSLLDAKNHQDSLQPADASLKMSKIPSVVKKQISSLLDADNQQDSLPNRVSGNNNGGNVDSTSHSILTTDEPIMLRLLFPLLGMSILRSLACDPDNREEIAKDATYITTKTIGLISYVIDEENSGGPQKKLVLRSSLNFVRAMGAMVVDIIAVLALEEAARQEIGSTQSIIPKLIHAFLMLDDRLPRMAAGEALANLTIMSTDNCWAILLADPDHNLIKNLINMLEDEYYIYVAADILHNLCANSRDKLMDIDFGANVHLESALQKVMKIIGTKEDKQLEAALCVGSQIGYVIPGCFARMLESYTDAAAAELVKKLVNILKSNRKPCPKNPRMRRVLIEVIISILYLCHETRYIKFFREKGLKDALDIVKGIPSRLEKYRVFLGGEGVLAESLPMRDLVDKAKRLIDPHIITDWIPAAVVIGLPNA
ncbi:hypothetical protein C2845_PM13G02910 [Panicum miliaceum]|uniref:Uncharacterized protein n=1 Tax=Panicum miliaceum TaxID=4540 RepID=A0A3L6RNJ5_PANMI|nr:hypothetical protein C2845_PM13G02910 [Panicum miliaceum]